MADQPTALAALLAHRAPTAEPARSLLVALRRIASGGINDAHAANAMLGACGIGYRRPLFFLRILMEEVSRVSQRSIAIAPCCCPRMTDGEAALLELCAAAQDAPQLARAALTRITGTLDHLPALFVAQGLAAALDDLGRPLNL